MEVHRNGVGRQALGMGMGMGTTIELKVEKSVVRSFLSEREERCCLKKVGL